MKRTSKAEPVLTVRTPNGETKHLHGKDFRWLDGEILGCENRPLSVVFVLFAGEELMALGSRYFLSACPVPRDKIIADIDLDMIGRTDKASETDRAHYALDTDNVRPEFKKLIMEVNDRTIRWPLKYECQPDNGSDNGIFELLCKIPGVFLRLALFGCYLLTAEVRRCP